MSAAIKQWLATMTLLQSVGAVAVESLPVAYQVVAKASLVPADILYAVATTESGRNYRGYRLPWPWTLNIEGQAFYCRSKKEAYHRATKAIQQQKSIDIGLMQINWRWHKHRFKNINEALTPMLNLKAGATILTEQYQQTNDWWQAVGRYHDPGQDQASLDSAESYRQRVKKQWQAAPK